MQRPDNPKQQLTRGEYVCMAFEFAFKFEHGMFSIMLIPKVLKHKIKIYQ